MSTEHFYSNLTKYPMIPDQLFMDQTTFTAIPHDWYVLATDIESSTQFFERGEYDIVNKLAAAGIDVVVRASVRAGVEVPYVFAGDGIIACFPPILLREISHEMVRQYHYGHAVCGAQLRVGIIPVADIHEAGHNLRIKRIGGEGGVISHTLFDDEAFSWIDTSIKTDTKYRIESILQSIDTTNNSYEDYVLPVWQKIKPVFSGEEFLCLVISARQPDRLTIYQDIVARVGELAPAFFTEHPLVAREDAEVFSVDFIKTSGVLNAIVSGNRQDLLSMVSYLEELERSNTIYFGHIISTNSIITYIIRESDRYSAGLLDIDNGGYVVAAREMKKKIKSREQ